MSEASSKPRSRLMCDSDLQVVPDCHPGAERPRKRTHADRGGISDAAFADIAALLAKSAYDTEANETDDLEPYRKMAKRIVVTPKMQFPGLSSHITLDELQRIHAMYVARKLKEAASMGKISATLVPELSRLILRRVRVMALLKALLLT
ncbi:Tyrosine recombinase XerS [Orchesella cincta]|uniref:Tyrosine recombinase XerS n=1 Tax=Orchesella cincta TaxID=48709 RepID=A0A1D2MB79_ORCCI|nr:Tyrosine recombinase XerS [Orchesella cincta]